MKIESGTKSTLDPNTERAIRPYVNDDAPDLDMSVANVTTVDPERMFWERVVILHGLQRWYERPRELRGGGQRISRHNYDIYRLTDSDAGRRAIADKPLGMDCVAHARMFVNRPDYDRATAESPTFALAPHDEMVEDLGRDYVAMSVMNFGAPPPFDAVMVSIADLQSVLNSVDQGDRS